MVYFGDTDIALALAACRLLRDLPRVLGVPSTSIRPLSELRRKMCSSTASKYPPEVRGIVMDFLNRIGQPIDCDPTIPVDPTERLNLNDCDDVDSGEAVLFLATRTVVQARILTGDMKSCRNLASSQACAAIHQRLQGRVVCLEQTLEAFINHHGFENVKGRILDARSYERSLYHLFPSDTLSEQRARQILTDRIANHREDTRGLLVSAI